MRMGPGQVGTWPSGLQASIQASQERQILNRDIQTAKNANLLNFRSSLTSSRDIEKKNSNPDRLVLSSRPASEAKETYQQQVSLQAENGTNSAEVPTLRPEDPKAEFLNSFSGTLDSSTEEQILKQAAASVQELGASSQRPEYEKVLAAHTFNHLSKSLKQKFPGKNPAQIREAVAGDPVSEKELSLFDKTTAFLRWSRTQSESPRPPEIKNQQQTQAQPTDQLEAQARAMAEAQKVREEIWKIYAGMAAENQKTLANCYHIAAQTAQDVSDIFREMHFKRCQSFDKQSQNMVYLLSEEWPS